MSMQPNGYLNTYVIQQTFPSATVDYAVRTRFTVRVTLHMQLSTFEE